MADNVTFQIGTPASPPALTSVATDDVGGVQYQRVKLDSGGDGVASPVSAANPLPVLEQPPSTAIITSVAQNDVSVQLLGSNANRRGIVIVNEQPQSEDGKSLYVGFAASTSLTAYTFRLAPGETLDRSRGYTGVISGIWEGAGAGAARITEERP